MVPAVAGSGVVLESRRIHEARIPSRWSIHQQSRNDGRQIVTQPQRGRTRGLALRSAGNC